MMIQASFTTVRGGWRQRVKEPMVLHVIVHGGQGQHVKEPMVPHVTVRGGSGCFEGCAQWFFV